LDTITIKGLQFFGKHGFYESERKKGNRFELDIIARGEFREAAENDDLEKTFNYESAEQIAGEVFAGESRKLIETLCSEIGDKLFDAHPFIRSLEVVLRKIKPPIKTPVEYAEIRMTWQR
jgi:dihydroneopterin aldolase